MEVTYEVVPNQRTMSGIKRLPDRVMYLVARQTLDLSYPIIPRDTGKLATTSMAFGVNRISDGYCIGSITDYASYVWNMEGVHWTTSGTNNKWFTRGLKRYGATITNNAINMGWKDAM